MPTIDIVQLIVNQRQENGRKQQLLRLFVQVSETFDRWPQWLRSGLTPNRLYYIALRNLRFN